MASQKNPAATASGGVKISELGKELSVDPRQIVAAAKEMTMENAKVPASWVTAGQADRLRAKFGGHKDLKAAIERKRRYVETGKLDEDAAPAAPPTAAPKLGKKTYEHDRRVVFGVVETPGGVRLDPGVSGAAKSAVSVKSAVSGVTRPPVETPDAPANLAAPLPPPKKFIGVQVAPPVRREPAERDERFGVVAPAPEAASAATGQHLWGKLNDGRPSMEFSAPDAEKKKSGEFNFTEISEPGEPVHAQPVEVAVEKVEPPAEVVEHPKKAKHAPEPAEDVAKQLAADAAADRGTHKKHDLVVPVKWEPKHRAFGAKAKHKHKKVKHIEAAKKHAPEKPEKKEAPPKRHSEKKHAEAQHKAPAKKEGLLSRLVKKIFKK